VGLLVAVAVGFSGLVEAQVRGLDEIRSSGTLRVGVNPNFPPMSSYGMTNQLEGFDVDIARRIAEALDVKLRLVPTAAQHRVAFLSSGRIDLALGALTQTPEREELIDFTIPLHTEAMSVLTTDRLDIDSWRELNRPDITLVNMRGNLSVELLKERLPKAKTLLVDGNADTIRALAQGRADALVENIDLFMKFTEMYRNVKWRHLDDVLYEAQCGVGTAKGNDDLRIFLDGLLGELHASGYVNARWEHWFGAPMTVPVEVPIS
jgi:polar amino acid transport system substrate-binding protein